jgi:hypothetical protein
VSRTTPAAEHACMECSYYGTRSTVLLTSWPHCCCLWRKHLAPVFITSTGPATPRRCAQCKAPAWNAAHHRWDAWGLTSAGTCKKVCARRAAPPALPQHSMLVTPAS